MMTDSRILRFLKSGTATQHETAEHRIDLAERLRAPSTYAALLGRMYGFYAPLEAALGRVPGYQSVGLDFEARRKTPLLVADLNTLGNEHTELPIAGDVPAPPTLGSALGCLYVLEGATLGGHVISKMVEKRLGFTAGNGGEFFSCYGDRIGTMWAEFRAALVRYATTPAEETEVVTAAQSTFDRFNVWFATAPWVTT